MVASLNDPRQRHKPFGERCKRAFAALAGMLDEVLWYGLFQQVRGQSCDVCVGGVCVVGVWWVCGGCVVGVWWVCGVVWCVWCVWCVGGWALPVRLRVPWQYTRTPLVWSRLTSGLTSSPLPHTLTAITTT